MAVDRGYGTGTARSASNSASRANAARAAANRKKTINRAGSRIGNTATAALKPLSGSSEYVVRENAARAQLGVSGQAARYRQLPKAARATARGFVRELTGIDVSRNGINANPFNVAMAFGPGKITRMVGIANRARNAGRLGETAYEAVMDRARAGELGRSISRVMAENRLKSVPNTSMNAGGYSRSTYLPVSEAVPARMDAQIIQQRFNTNPGSFYSSGVPAGGWRVSPNLRRNTPVESNYPVALGGMRVNNSGMSPGTRSTILSLLDEATVARNLSAGMKPGGRTFFPRTWQEISRSQSAFDPATYRGQAFTHFTEKIRRNVK